MTPSAAGLALIPFMPAKMAALREAFGLRGDVDLDADPMSFDTEHGG